MKSSNYSGSDTVKNSKGIAASRGCTSRYYCRENHRQNDNAVKNIGSRNVITMSEKGLQKHTKILYVIHADSFSFITGTCDSKMFCFHNASIIKISNNNNKN